LVCCFSQEFPVVRKEIREFLPEHPLPLSQLNFTVLYKAVIHSDPGRQCISAQHHKRTTTNNITCSNQFIYAVRMFSLVWTIN
jgi:hypothetical protein